MVFFKKQQKDSGNARKGGIICNLWVFNLKSVRDLIFKTGLEKLEKERVPLIDSNDIKQALGSMVFYVLRTWSMKVILLVHIYEDATRFLWPFSLSKPECEFLGMKNTFKNVGDSRNREEHINDLIAKMT
ncbi:60S ribosomal protein L7 [Bienertia sinuspersici]